MKSLETALKHQNNCGVCGKEALSRRRLCRAPSHLVHTKGRNGGNKSFFNFYDNFLFGMSIFKITY